MSSRARAVFLVALCAAAAGAVAAVVAWVGRGDTVPAAASEGGVRAGAPPLALDALTDDAALAADLEEASRLYADGRRDEARAAFERIVTREPSSVEAAVGEAVARWPRGALAALRALAREHPGSALVTLHEGLVLFWLGQEEAATEAWREALADDPDSPAAVRAESLLHPEMPAGRPFFVPSRPVPPEVADLTPPEQLSALERRAAERDDAAAWLAYGVALQRAGRSLSAQEAFDRAVELAPDDPEPLAAAAVARFTKDEPAEAFSRLGPLGRRFPDAAVVPFHLGLLLLWLGQVSEARTQLEVAVSAGADTIYGRQATELLDRLATGGADGAPASEAPAETGVPSSG